MADFVAVLKKTIDGLGDNSPQTREKVYEKARATISAKLAALSPAPASIVIERQKKSLEDAIQIVEREFALAASPSAPLFDELDEIFASLDPSRPKTAVAEDGVSPFVAAEAPAASPGAPEAPETVMGGAPPARDRPAIAEPSLNAAAGRQETGRSEPGRSGSGFNALSRGGRRGKGGTAAFVVTLVLLMFVGAAGYALWMNRAEVQSLLGLSQDGEQGQEQVAAPATPDIIIEEEGTDGGEDDAVDGTPPPVPEAAEGEDAAPAPAGEPNTDIAAVAPPTATPAPTQSGPQKFTQRLTADGREVDVGPAGVAPSVGEGTSVATAVISDQPPAQGQPQAKTPAQDNETADDAAQAPPQTPPAASEAPAPAQATQNPGSTAPATPAAPAIAVGQRAIFYEERTSSVQGSAETGSIVWSLVQESPGGDLPPEPTIRAEATIPAKDLQLRLTIRRNRDQTLPASHIVEIIFLTPDNFEGGGIENVLRMTMKTSEEAPGNPLLGIPAKIADGFFLIALTDGKPEIEQNIGLLARDQWIDVPMVYRSGRRALITLEKGIPGGKVFDAAIKAWQNASSG